jgi:hypothetical protein
MGSTGVTFTMVFKLTGRPLKFQHLFFGRRTGLQPLAIRIYRYLDLPKLVLSISLLNNDGIIFYPVTNFPQNEVHRIAFVMDPKMGAFGKIALWVNGTETETILLPKSMIDRTTSENYISRSDSATNMCLQAEIFSFKIFSSALNANALILHTMQEAPTAGPFAVFALHDSIIYRINGSQFSAPYSTNCQLPILEPQSILLNGTGQHTTSTCRNIEFGKFLR